MSKIYLYMAIRPVFFPVFDKSLILQKDYEFLWNAGFSKVQKELNVKALHASAKERDRDIKILEVSTKSNIQLGVNLSAFNLKINTDNFGEICVESLYQGSKVYSELGQIEEFFNMNPFEIKKRLREIEEHKKLNLIEFKYNSTNWPLSPKEGFYNWLYISALHKNPKNDKLKEDVLQFNAFTDIEFNPHKDKVNCQAKSCAIYASLVKQNLIDKALKDKNSFINLFSGYQIPLL